MTRAWVVLGGGGHARVVVDTLRAIGTPVLGFTAPQRDRLGKAEIDGVEHLGGDDVLDRYGPEEVVLANGIGSVAVSPLRSDLFERFRARSFAFPTFAHPSANVSPTARLAPGAQVMAGAVLQPGCQIGDNTIVNTRTSVDHDCIIGAHVHLAPGVTLSGGVHVGVGSHIGTGATVIQNVNIGSHCVVGAGAVVVRDIPDGTTVVGVPAKPLHP